MSEMTEKEDNFNGSNGKGTWTGLWCVMEYRATEWADGC